MKKMTLIPLVGLLLFGGQARADLKLPSLWCWDQSFAYQVLETSVQGDQLHAQVSSGLTMSLDQSLVPLDPDDTWGSIKVWFSIPVESCRVSIMDSNMFTCTPDHLSVRVLVRPTEHKKIEKTLEFKSAVVELRKVFHVSTSGKETVGYEFMIANDRDRTPLLIQKYYHEYWGDQTGNCKNRGASPDAINIKP